VDRVSLIMMECINNIEDYFEYRHKSEEDKEVVMRCIDTMTERLKEGVTETEHLNKYANNRSRLMESITQYENGEAMSEEEINNGDL
jgi:hypothetical protein